MHLLIHMSSVICCPLQGYHPLDTDLSAVSTNEYGGKLPIFSTSTEHATPEDADMWIKDGMSLEMSITCEENDPTKATLSIGTGRRKCRLLRWVHLRLAALLALRLLLAALLALRLFPRLLLASA
jgi:hypothetical protein